MILFLFSRTVTSHRHSVSERLMLYYPIVNKRPLSSVLKSGRALLSRKHTVNAFCGCKLNFGARLDSKHLIIPRHLLFPNWTRSHCRTSNEKKKKTDPFTSIYPVGQCIQAPARWKNSWKRKYKYPSNSRTKNNQQGKATKEPFHTYRRYVVVHLQRSHRVANI